MSRKAAGRRETRSHDTSDPSLEYRDQTLYLYTFETIKKYYYTSLTDTAYTSSYIQTSQIHYPTYRI